MGGGANCSIYGCSTSRKNKDVGIFRLPAVKDDLSKKWREELLNVILRDRVLDESLKRQIEKNTLHICQLHFKEDDLYYYPSRKQLKEGVLPTLNLPVKSIPKTEHKQRPTTSLEKRQLFHEQHSTEQSDSPQPSVYKDFNDFAQRVQKLKLKSCWTILFHNEFIEINCKFDNEEDLMLPYIQIYVNKDLSYRIRCFGWLLSTEHQIFSSHPSFTYVTLNNFICILNGYQLCSGLDLVEFKQATHLQHHIVPKQFNFLKSCPESPVTQKEFIRSLQCKVLVVCPTSKCISCKQLEVKTRSELNYKKVSSAAPAKLNAPIKFTSSDRVKATIQSHRLENTLLKNKITEMATELKKNSMDIDSELNNDLVDIFKGIPHDKVPPFMRLFWEEQQKYLRTSHSSQIRYHPAIIKFCLSIAAKSPAAYNQLRLDSKEGNGILVLPSQRTLRDYRNYIRPQQGFNPEVIKELSHKIRNFTSSERFITILFDEMKVQEDLVWDRSTGQLIGFIDLGDSTLNESTFKNVKKLATHVLVFIAKSVKNPLTYSFANFATDGITSYQLYNIFWKAVSILELSCQLKVIAAVSDGASPNRKFVKMNKMADDESDVVYCTINRFSTDGPRYIYFFSDAPHLLKTARNCLWKSGSDTASRHMWNNGIYLIWRHISELYKEDIECGLKLLPKLTADHIFLNSYSVMKVKLATQILSFSVGKVLDSFGYPEAKGTSEFCLKFDSFFDCFNVRNTKEHLLKRKDFLKPYTEVDDFRFAWLDIFIQYLENWKKSIMEREGAFSQADRNNMFISHQTYEGLKMSIYSLKEVVPFLLRNGLDYVLSEKFCQDDVENYFGRQRAIGRRKDNPNVKDTLYGDNIIKTQFDVTHIAGNVRNTVNNEIDTTPLKKRKSSN